MIQPTHYLLLSAVLLAAGIITVTTRRQLVILLLGIELMLQAASLACAALASWFQDWGGQIALLAIFALSAGQLAIGLAAIVALGNAPPRHEPEP